MIIKLKDSILLQNQVNYIDNELIIIYNYCMIPKFLDDNKILEKKVINKNLKKNFMMFIIVFAGKDLYI